MQTIKSENTKSFKLSRLGVEQLLRQAGMVEMKNRCFFIPGRYTLQHGEIDRPDFCARRYKDGWGIHAKYYYIPGTLHARKSGRVDLQIFCDKYGSAEIEIHPFTAAGDN